jgi:hypothetical protein
MKRDCKERRFLSAGADFAPIIHPDLSCAAAGSDVPRCETFTVAMFSTAVARRGFMETLAGFWYGAKQ